MPTVTMPQLGESVAEGTIGKWLKKVGDHVDKYEPIVEVITDKVNAEVPSPFEGTLTEILVKEGETVPNNAEIAVIEARRGRGGAAPQPGTPSGRLRRAADGRPPSAEARPNEPEPADPAPARSGTAGAARRPAPGSQRPRAGPQERAQSRKCAHSRRLATARLARRRLRRSNDAGGSAAGARARRRPRADPGHRPRGPRHARGRPCATWRAVAPAAAPAPPPATPRAAPAAPAAARGTGRSPGHAAPSPVAAGDSLKPHRRCARRSRRR